MTNLLAVDQPVFRISKKWRIGVFAISLVFVGIGIGAIMDLVRDPMFVAPVRAKLDQVNSLRELGPVRGEIDKEKAVFDRFGIFALAMALILPAAGLFLLRRVKSWMNFLLFMLAGGLVCGVTLSALHGALHGLILPGGLQSPDYRAALRWSFLGLSLLDSLVVAAVFQKVVFKKRG